MASPREFEDFFQSVAGYDQFMGRYARPLAKEFVRLIPLDAGDSVLDIGCGSGALTAELVNQVGAEFVYAIDPSEPFLNYCSVTYPGITARVARAESIPFPDNSFTAAFSQLVIHFVEDLPQAGREILRVTKPGGKVAVCTWNIERMQKINLLPRAATAAGIEVPPLRVETFSDPESVRHYLESISLGEVEETTITVRSDYENFEELWSAYLTSIGPMGPWTVAQPDDVKAAIKKSLFNILGEPGGQISLSAEARAAVGKVPL